MGLEVKLTITRKDDDATTDGKNNNHLDMEVESTGKYKRKSTWDDLSAFSGHDVTSDLLKDWIYNYQKLNFPDKLDLPNHRPYKCFIFDEPKTGHSLFKDYGWNPVKLELKIGTAEIKSKSTQKISFVGPILDYSDIDTQIQKNSNLPVVSTITKSKLAGHPLAVEMMKSSSTIETNFQGFEKDGFFITPINNKTPDGIDEETGSEIWKNTKPLGELLGDGYEKPSQKEAGYKYEIIAYESKVKTRIYYKAQFTGEVSTDHKEKYDGRRYWNFPLKYLLQYNDVPKQQLIYEDIEYIFYTGFAIIDIEPDMMTIIVVNELDGKTYEIQAKPADTVDIIKSKIHRATSRIRFLL